MAENLNQTITGGASERKQDKIIELRPTLFIGIGGTGMQVLMRVRRRILNTLWGGAGNRTRIEGLSDFPIAQFIHFDLDNGAVIESGESQAKDLQFDQVKFTDDDKVVESFDMDKYSRDEDSLEKYPHIKEWLPLTPQRIRELRFDMSSGAGQIRAVSRLYFFDKYAKIRDKIRLKLKALKAGLSHERQLAELGLRMETNRFRIVIVGSVAGGTGSGSFLDMGLLARWLARSEVGAADVELMLFLPTGYTKANKDRVEANGYAALMELESAMMGNKGYVGRWDAYDRPELTREPYSEVYLIDSGNLAQQHTKEVSDVYHMVADSLFEDFASADFARAKRSIAVNQAQHKNSLYNAPVPQDRFGDMRLYFSKRFSSFGMAVLDTRQEAARDERAHRWAGAMLQAFFGVGGTDAGANRATDTQRDNFLAANMFLKGTPFSDFPEFSDKSIELKRSSGDFIDFRVVDELLEDRHGHLLAGVENRVNTRINDIRTGFDRSEWPAQVRDAMKHLERDAVRDQDSTADTTEDRISKRRREVLDDVKKVVRDQLYGYLDNKEFGGLEYVLSLVEQIKDRIEAPGSGLTAQIGANAERYREIKEAVRSREYERLLNNLEQTRSTFGFLSNGEKQAGVVMDHLRTEMANALKFHLRAKAADESVILLGELSRWLGNRIGVDGQGRAQWNGLVGELQSGREGVLAMLAELKTANTILQKDLDKEHATLIVIPVTEKDIALPSAATLRQWADEAFKDMGGSKALFPMLGEPAQRGLILAKVTRMAENMIATAGLAEGATSTPDPLFDALEQMDVSERLDRFRKLLACSMPWIDANMAGDFTVVSDQFKCVIGVANAAAFKAKFGAELESCMPTQVGITVSQLEIVETGIRGRAVCYCELAGVPMTVLRGLEGWRTSYRKEGDNDKAPTHTHIDPTQFTHPIAPNTDEMKRLAEDFGEFLQAIMLGVLTRHTGRVVPPGQYQFAVEPGDLRRIGNERAIRQNGMPASYEKNIALRIEEKLTTLDAVQTAAMAALAKYYERGVYAPKLVAQADGSQLPYIGFGSAISAELGARLRESARRKGMASDELDRTVQALLGRLKEWANVIGDSDSDAYDWEVREPEADGQPRLKYAIKPEMLEAGRLEQLLRPAGAAAPAVAPFGMAPPPLGGMPPPLVEFQYFLGINGQQQGPFTAQQIVQYVQAGQVVPATAKVWRAGLPAWVDLAQFAELAPLFFSAPPPLMPPPL
ncbi:tubulin-like doman-containing protein [Janthinobacterium sp.]|uniref:tubulin-like doman-containing protein n=1 Tax=Janthinobacterium sp. TaxID=1871054 RepID=UPI00258F0F9B|nr:tubulin-like doman-containing protein [Janthinobacterium sp.]MCX7292469.1 GYF domain-containing protein [Janthinobacterium sp.]